jgi:hypothetical protein
MVLGGSRRFPSSSYPVAKGADFDAEQRSEFCLARFGRLTQLLDHCSVNAKFSPIRIAAVSIPEAQCKAFLPAKSAFGR